MAFWNLKSLVSTASKSLNLEYGLIKKYDRWVVCMSTKHIYFVHICMFYIHIYSCFSLYSLHTYMIHVRYVYHTHKHHWLNQKCNPHTGSCQNYITFRKKILRFSTFDFLLSFSIVSHFKLIRICEQKK